VATRAITPLLLRGVRMPALSDRFVILLFCAAAFLIRFPHFANPYYEIDEGFYLVVGDRLIHGFLPYIDIWDRKPIGLFLIYGAIRLLGGTGLLQYHVVATLFAAGTSWLIYRIACPVAGRFGAIIAGLAYLLWIETIEGGGGQAPIFYNLFTAAMAALTLRALGDENRTPFHLRAGCAMLLGGLAIQVKYTALFEVAYFGALLGCHLLRHERLAVAAGKTFLLAIIALAPTLTAIGFYAAIGQLPTFWFANFQSIFYRETTDPGELHHALIEMIKHVSPLAVCFVAGLWHLRHSKNPATRFWQSVMGGWLIAALIGYFSVGALFPHYMLPLFVPLAIAASPIFRRWPLGIGLSGLVLWIPFSNLDYPDFSTTDRVRAETDALARLIPADVDRGCLQIFAGPPILYLRTRACFASRYIFGDHLVSRVETHAIGTDPRKELRNLFARRPRALLIDDAGYKLDPASFALVKALRARSYKAVGSARLEGHKIDVWVSSARASP
jgi:Dolichyl-phosphate-mannose-protein mannosyltransferase